MLDKLTSRQTGTFWQSIRAILHLQQNSSSHVLHKQSHDHHHLILLLHYLQYLCIELGCTSVIFSDSLSSLEAIHSTRLDVPMIRDIAERCHHLHTVNNTDLRQKVNAHFITKWQTRWNTTAFNKLQTVKSQIGETELKNIVKRREEVVLHRARVGHTHLTHSYLLRGEDATECIPCQCLLTVEHVLIHCVDFALIRIKYCSVTSIKQLFDTVDSWKICELSQRNKSIWESLKSFFIHILVYLFEIINCTYSCVYYILVN